MRGCVKTFSLFFAKWRRLTWSDMYHAKCWLPLFFHQSVGAGGGKSGSPTQDHFQVRCQQPVWGLDRFDGQSKVTYRRETKTWIKEQPLIARLIYDLERRQGRMSSQGGPKLVSIIGLLHLSEQVSEERGWEQIGNIGVRKRFARFQVCSSISPCMSRPDKIFKIIIIILSQV